MAQFRAREGRVGSGERQKKKKSNAKLVTRSNFCDKGVGKAERKIEGDALRTASHYAIERGTRGTKKAHIETETRGFLSPGRPASTLARPTRRRC